MSRKQRPSSGHNAPIPPKYARIKERVQQIDRAWFARRPGESYYVRPYVPGELWPGHDDRVSLTLVTQVCPGFRLREAIAHVYKTRSNRITIIGQDGQHLYDLPMEGWP